MIVVRKAPRPTAQLAKCVGVPELGWLLNWRLPVAMAMPYLLTMGLMFGLAIFPEGRLINPLEQYKGIFPGDLFLATANAIAVFQASRYACQGLGCRWRIRPRSRVAALVAALLVGGLLVWRELSAMWHDPYGPATYTLDQFWSPTHIAHTAIVPLWAYVTLVFVVPVLYRAAEWLWGMLIMVGYGAWAYCAVYYDNTHPRPNLANVHPLDGGWLGGWWPHVWQSVFG